LESANKIVKAENSKLIGILLQMHKFRLHPIS